MPFTLKDIKNKTLDKEDLFSHYDNVKTIYDLKKHLNVKTADEAYQIALDNMNQIVANFEKKRKQKEEEKKAKKKENVIRRALKKLKEQQGEFQVNITATVNVHWKVTNKQYQENTDFFEKFNTTKSQLPNKISEYLNSIFPIEDEYKLVNLVSFDYQIIEDKPDVHKLDIPMKKSIPLKLSFLKYFDKINPISYEDHKGECVIKTLMEHLKIKKEKTITDILKEASIKLYNKEWNNKDGITSRMILYFCKEKNISCLGFDQKDKLFLMVIKSIIQLYFIWR